jgi:predicted RNase H-like nuclease
MASRSIKSPDRYVAGIDGCRGGWCLAIGEIDRDAVRVKVQVVDLFPAAVAAASDASEIAVDIPIGLPDRGARACDLIARGTLGSRWMCVFPAPPRAVVMAGSYDEANRRHRYLCGKGLSRQAWGIAPKIAEVDAYLLSNAGSRDRVWEVHPEICFMAMNGGTPLLARKGSQEGFKARHRLLRRVVPNLDQAVQEALAAWPRRLLQKDDVLDAIVACVTVAFWDPKSSIVAPQATHDSFGLPIQMRCLARSNLRAMRFEHHPIRVVDNSSEIQN